MNPVKKKGGITIKNKIIFLILLSCIFSLGIKVQAETTSFYEAEYIDGIYMSKYNTQTRVTYYQKARFFRKTGTEEFAYCIEPFKFFQEGEAYISTENPNLTETQLDRISKIAYYGYGYKNHTDSKWYAITQMMIWQASDISGNYYFTDTLNGQPINRFLEEMNEINNLINESTLIPSFSNQTFQIVEQESRLLEDKNHIINQFQSFNENVTIQNNTLKIENLKAGNYTFQIIKKQDNYHKPLIFYQSNNSQNLVKTGDIKDIIATIHIEVIKTSIQGTKIDKDTKSIIPSGNAKLDGAIYELYNEEKQLIKTLEINNNQFQIENLSFGKYYLKEISPGTGYTLNDTFYQIELSKETPTIDLILENEVIKKRIIIQKKYGEQNNLQNEKNITFQIINNINNEIKEITTNEEGIIELILPYGEYTIMQVNTTDGYQKIEPITLIVEDSEEEYIELKDLKIPVPNTYTSENSIIEILLLLISIFL